MVDSSTSKLSQLCYQRLTSSPLSRGISGTLVGSHGLSDSMQIGMVQWANEHSIAHATFERQGLNRSRNPCLSENSSWLEPPLAPNDSASDEALQSPARPHSDSENALEARLSALEKRMNLLSKDNQELKQKLVLSKGELLTSEQRAFRLEEQLFEACITDPHSAKDAEAQRLRAELLAARQACSDIALERDKAQCEVARMRCWQTSMEQCPKDEYRDRFASTKKVLFMASPDIQEQQTTPERFNRGISPHKTASSAYPKSESREKSMFSLLKPHGHIRHWTQPGIIRQVSPSRSSNNSMTSSRPASSFDKYEDEMRDQERICELGTVESLLNDSFAAKYQGSPLKVAANIIEGSAPTNDFAQPWRLKTHRNSRWT